MLRRTALALVPVLLLAPLWAAEDKPAPPPSAEKLIEQLGSRDFRVREAAAKALETQGAPALEKLRKAAAASTDSVQLARNPGPRQRGIRHQRQGLPSEVVHDRQHAEASPVGQRVGDEVE